MKTLRPLLAILLIVALGGLLPAACGTDPVDNPKEEVVADAGGGDQQPADTGPQETAQEQPADSGSPVDETEPQPDTSMPDEADAGTPDQGTADEPPDAAQPPEMTPEVTPEAVGSGLGFIINKLILVTDPSVGFDISSPADGKVDNALGVALAAFATSLQSALDSALAQGQIILLLELVNASDPKVQTGTVDLFGYYGTKTTTPGEYKISPSSLNQLTGLPHIKFLNSAVKAGVVTTGFGDFTMDVPLGGPPVRITLKRTRFTFKVDNSLPGALKDGMLGGAVPVGTLDKVPNPLTGTGSLLPLLLSLSTARPDIDVDGDGLEKVEVDMSGQLKCTDGDGKEVKKGTFPSCAQDPRMADGFSMTFKFEAGPAKLVR